MSLLFEGIYKPIFRPAQDRVITEQRGLHCAPLWMGRGATGFQLSQKTELPNPSKGDLLYPAHNKNAGSVARV